MVRHVKWGLLLATSLALAGCGSDGQGRRSWVEGPGTFHEKFEAFDAVRWRRSDGWASGASYHAGWRADHVLFAQGKMTLQLDTQPCPEGCSGRPHASGEVASNRFHGYGHYEVRMKPARGSGTLTTFIVHTGPKDWTRWDEIDIGFLGRDTRQLQVNYVTDGTGYYHSVTLPFDAADDFHTYGFEWTREAIHWYVDGERVHTETGSRGPLPSVPGRILMNFWPGIGPGTEYWMGRFTYPGTPMVSVYEEVRHGLASPTELLETFEEPESVGAWVVSVEGGSSLKTWRQEGHQGKALVLAYSIPSTGRARATRTFAAPRDWRGVRYLNFWLRGTGTQNPFRLELLDAARRFEYRFQDDVVGWKWVSVPMQSFKGLDVSAVRGISLEPLGGQDTVFLDDIELER